MRHGWLLAPFVLVCSNASAQVTTAERDAISNALKIANLSSQDFEYDRRPVTVQPLIPFVEQLLQKPLTAVDDLIAFHQFAEKGSLPALLDKAGATLGPSGSLLAEPTAYSGKVPETIPPELRGPVEAITHAIAASNDAVRTALAKLSAEERRVLIEQLPKFAAQGAPLEFSFSKTPLDEARVLKLIQKVDVSMIIRASARLATEIRAQLPAIEDVAKKTDWKEMVIAKVDGVNIEISGKGDDIHSTTDSMLCIDLGGRNQYTGRYGAGIGYSSVLISMGSTDTFTTPDASIGCGLLGIGFAYIVGGDDQFECGSLSLGAGLAGVGALVKSGGNDHYRAEGLAMGFGQYGVGLLIDTTGDNDYVSSAYSQGCARTSGLGWLINRAGRHTYHVVTPEGIDSNSQGWSGGYAGNQLPGGIGLVSDFGSGKTVLQGDTECQGSGRYGGVGSIYCTGTANTLTSAGQAQGYGYAGGIGAAILIGNDNGLIVRGGPCHGSGFDGGVGLVMSQGDRGQFVGGDSRPGSGFSNGVGFLLASGNGNRFYSGTTGMQADHPGLGLFVNLGIEPRFEGGLESGEAMVSQGWSTAFSKETDPRSPVQSPNVTQHPKPGSEAMPSDAVIESIYNRASGGGTESLTAFDRLVAIGPPAVGWIVQHKLSGTSASQEQLIANLIKAIGVEGEAPLAKAIQKTEGQAQVGLRIAALAGASSLGASIAKALGVPELQRQAAVTAGEVKAKEAIQALLPLTVSKDERLAQIATEALAKIGDLEAVPTAEALLTSQRLPIRKSAMRLMAKFPERALDWADRFIKSADERSARLAIEVLGLTGTPNALARVGPYLSDTRAGIRIQALLALDGQCPAEFRAAASALRQDTDALVRAVALGVDCSR